MRTRRTTLAAVVAASAATALLLSACGAPQSSDNSNQMELSYATYVNANDTFAQQAKWFMDEVTKRTNGDIEFKTYYSESLLGADEILNGIKDGRADLGHVANVYSPSELPLSQITVPFVSNNGEAVAQALTELYSGDDAFRGEWEKQGAKVLAFGIVGSAAIGAKTPMKDLNDLQGKRLRGVGMVAEALQSIGVQPVAVAAPEIYEGIQRGVLDGYAGLPLQTAIGLKMHEVAPQMLDTDMGVFAAVGVVTISERTWKKLSKDVQKIMVQVGTESLQQAAKIVVKADKDACDELHKTGGQVTVVPQAESDSWRARVFDNEIQQWQKDAVKAGVDKTEAVNFRTRFLKSVSEHEAKSDFVDGLRACGESRSR